MLTLRIHQLPDILANKIAAGEVVERPASVIKELIENSIDANSSSIKVELQEAGLTEMKVTDNGEGMGYEDCKRAFLRHATSKIKYDADLFHIASLGFRGEALASIAAVSKLTIMTSTGNEAGTKLYLEAGHIVDESKSPARQGTEIIVRELFYNTPARLKYMKTIHTELGHITDLINRYALAHPSIRFEIFHNGKEVFKTPGNNNRLQVIRQIYGMQIAQNMLPVKASSLDFDIEGFIAKPNQTRANRNFITIIVNGRYIKSHALTHAIVRAYDTLLMIHRYPIVVLAITLDPILIDVNVHPTKLEVRFSKEKELIALIEGMIRDVLKQTNLIPNATFKQRSQNEKPVQNSFTFTQKTEQITDDAKQVESDKTFQFDKTNDFFTSTTNNEQINKEQIQEAPLLAQESIGETPTSPNEQDEQKDVTEVETRYSTPRVPPMYPIGQLQGTYILAQNELGFYMIDQHAAQERIKYEFYKVKLGIPQQDVQHLLLPLTFEFTTEEMLFIEKHKAALQEAGLFLEPFGDKTYAVRAHPNWFPSGEEELIIRDMVEQIIQKGQINIESIREEVAILMSCKHSIKANHYLTEEDMIRLLEDLRQTNDPFTCPHGRPVIVHLTNYDIEKMFKRIQ